MTKTVEMVNSRGTIANVPADAVSVWESMPKESWVRTRPVKKKASSEEAPEGIPGAPEE